MKFSSPEPLVLISFIKWKQNILLSKYPFAEWTFNQIWDVKGSDLSEYLYSTAINEVVVNFCYNII